MQFCSKMSPTQRKLAKAEQVMQSFSFTTSERMLAGLQEGLARTVVEFQDQMKPLKDAIQAATRAKEEAEKELELELEAANAETNTNAQPQKNSSNAPKRKKVKLGGDSVGSHSDDAQMLVKDSNIKSDDVQTLVENPNINKSPKQKCQEEEDETAQASKVQKCPNPRHGLCGTEESEDPNEMPTDSFTADYHARSAEDKLTEATEKKNSHLQFATRNVSASKVGKQKVLRDANVHRHRGGDKVSPSPTSRKSKGNSDKENSNIPMKDTKRSCPHVLSCTALESPVSDLTTASPLPHDAEFHRLLENAKQLMEHVKFLKEIKEDSDSINKHCNEAVEDCMRAHDEFMAYAATPRMK